MNSSSLTSNKFSIVRDDDGIPIAGSVSLNVDGKTATFSASSDLSIFPRYIATIRKEVCDLVGNNMEYDYSWSFTTKREPDLIPPIVEEVSPPNGSSGLHIRIPISARFSEQMDSSAITDSTFTVSDGLHDISGRVSLVADGRKAVFTWYSDLNYHTDYYGKVSRGTKDLARNPLVNDIWKFSTDKGEGNTPSDQEHKSDTPSSGNGKDDSGEILGKKNVGVLNLNLEMKIVLPIDDDSIKSLSLSKKNQKPGSLSDADKGNEQI